MTSELSLVLETAGNGHFAGRHVYLWGRGCKGLMRKILKFFVEFK